MAGAGTSLRKFMVMVIVVWPKAAVKPMHPAHQAVLLRLISLCFSRRPSSEDQYKQSSILSHFHGELQSGSSSNWLGCWFQREVRETAKVPLAALLVWLGTQNCRLLSTGLA